MYVQCERCQAEYEFDDALVSERGTTVKCTSCGHQFKIKRATPGAGDGDRWVVTTESGQSHVFSSLKELQRAIIARTVSKNDQLSRSGLPPRALASIAELEPFFEERRAKNPSIPDGRPAPQLATSTRPPPPPVPGSLPPMRPPMRSDAARSGSRPSIPPPHTPAPRINTIRPTDAPLPPPPNPSKGPWSGDDTPTHALKREQPMAAPPPTTVPPVAKKPPVPTTSKAPPPPPPRPPSRPPEMELTPELSSPLPPAASDPARISASDQLRARPSYIDAPYSHPAKRRVGGWVVGAALLAGVIAIGFYMTKRNADGATTASNAKADPRTQQFLAAGEAALAQGNLELAKENVDKATALAEKSPDVLLASARLAAARADLAWLRQKLLVADSDEARVAKQSLDDLASSARKAADEAQKSSPEDVALTRARIDALRISGDLGSARSLVDKILSSGTQPETAYVLAALDLAESDPPWSVVLPRLRAAAAGEGAASRARAALVYALARSGDGAEARKELDRLAAQPRVHPLLAQLRAYVDRTAGAAKDAGAPKPVDSVASVDIAKLPTAGNPTTNTSSNTNPTPNPNPNPTPNPTPNANTGTGTGTGGTSTAGLPSDPRTLIRMAESAKGKRDYDRAKTLYEAALAKNGSDSEALAGLADVTRAQGDSAGAQTLYKRALGANPSYLPALVALADLQWEGGDKGSAQKAYRDIVDRFPEPAYPARVKQRAEGN